MNEEFLTQALSDVPEIMELLSLLNDLGLPNHYLAGGSVTQVVWNKKLGNEALFNVKDFDVIYFDQLGKKTQQDYEIALTSKKTFSTPIDVTNQATLYEWYGAKFGNDIAPLTETEDGIRMWLPCFAVGVRLEGEKIKVFAPFGLEDQANRVVRPNKSAMSKDNYDAMNRSFKQRWPDLEIKPW